MYSFHHVHHVFLAIIELGRKMENWAKEIRLYKILKNLFFASNDIVTTRWYIELISTNLDYYFTYVSLKTLGKERLTWNEKRIFFRKLLLIWFKGYNFLVPAHFSCQISRHESKDLETHLKDRVLKSPPKRGFIERKESLSIAQRCNAFQNLNQVLKLINTYVS